MQHLFVTESIRWSTNVFHSTPLVMDQQRQSPSQCTVSVFAFFTADYFVALSHFVYKCVKLSLLKDSDAIVGSHIDNFAIRKMWLFLVVKCGYINVCVLHNVINDATRISVTTSTLVDLHITTDSSIKDNNIRDI